MGLGIDGGFAEGLGNVLVGAGLVAAEVQQGVRVAGDGFPGVLKLLLDLRHVLDNGAAGDVSGPHGCQFAGQPRQIDRGCLIQDEVDMPGQRTVVDLVCTVVEGLEHLGIKQTYQKVIGIVIVRDNSVQGTFLLSQRVQIHIVVVRDGPDLGQIEGRQTHGGGHEDAFGSFARGHLKDLILPDGDAVRLFPLHGAEQQIQR